MLSLLLALVPDDDEGAAVFVFGDLGLGGSVSFVAPEGKERGSKYHWTYQVLQVVSARMV